MRGGCRCKERQTRTGTANEKIRTWQEIQSTSQMVDTFGGKDKYLILFAGERKVALPQVNRHRSQREQSTQGLTHDRWVSSIE